MSRGAGRAAVLLLPLLFFGLLHADEPPPTPEPTPGVTYWSISGVSQEGPEDPTWYGLRFLYMAVCDDETCHTPVGLYLGGEYLRAEEGSIARALASLTIIGIAFGPRFSEYHDRSRFALWIRPTLSVDWLWDAPEEGVGLSAGFGGEVLFRPSLDTQVAFGWERYFSSVLGSRNQLSIAFRWAAPEWKSHAGPPYDP